MKTRIFSSKEVSLASELIKKGEVVVFPTETVYGIGANALDFKAVDKIFVSKGRPSDNPLIVHIARKEDVEKIARIPEGREELVSKLIDKFWPGPLTLILKKKKVVPKRVSGGLDSLAIRMPKNKIALNLIKYSKVPIAAPSANISGKPSGTCFEHVLEDFNGRVAGIIKSKPSKIGLESTVVDLTSKKILILRPGGISLEKLKKVIPEIEIGFKKKSKELKSPGMKYIHYSPEAKIFLFEEGALVKMKQYKKKLEKQNKRVKIVRASNSLCFAKNLFKIFRNADKEEIEILLISSVGKKGIGLSINNRLRKAASKIIKRPK
jgi:L-threonylcarbamoyladenylate synthase